MLLTPEQVQRFERDGYVLQENAFSSEEIGILVQSLESSERLKNSTFSMPDTDGRASKLSLWRNVSADVFGLVSTSPRIINNCRLLLREDIYHWHSKVMMKEARTGGAWEWHQDYGYWYDKGALYPRLISCMIALDPATRENGCLKVIAGSHLLGRLDHGARGNQKGSDPERVNAIVERLPVHYCEAPAGSVLYFHCNTFHASEANTSDRQRRAYICCYNAWSNVPYAGKGDGPPVEIQLSSDDAILAHARNLAPA